MRRLFRWAVYASAFTIVAMVNSVLGWGLPLPDLIPDAQPAPQCVVPGTTPQTTPPGAAVTAYGNPAATTQPALSFTDVFPDIPSAMGALQGQALRKLNGPPPSQAQIAGFIGAIKGGVVRWGKSLRASARGEKKPAEVSAYETRKRQTLAQNVTSCNPCQPGMDGSGGSGMVAYKGALTAEQRANAAIIAGVGVARGIPAQGQVVALATALQESGLRNLHYGDRDSLGAFQQRAGWGTPAERMNVAIAARKFYDALERVPGWQTMPVTVAAQRVQRSAYPAAYARWEGTARAALNGATTTAQPVAGMTCAVYPTKPAGGPRVAAGAWGGYSNGRIPTDALKHPATAPNQLLEPEAADAFDQLSNAYRAQFGHPLGVTDSYRSYALQVITKRNKPGLAAEPGTSNHGWGLALDIVVGSYSSADYKWLRANAPRFGWDNPTWARQGGSREEKWHWEFARTKGSTT